MDKELFNPKTVKKLCSKTGVTDSQKKAVEELLSIVFKPLDVYISFSFLFLTKNLKKSKNIFKILI